MAEEIGITAKTEAEKRDEALREEIRVLRAEIEAAGLTHGAQVIPRYWKMGRDLALLSGPVRDKYSVAGGKYTFHITRQIANRFATLEEARSFKGSLNELLKSFRDNDGSARRTIEKLVNSLMKAAKGDGRRVLRMFIRRGHWRIDDVLEWLQVEELEEKRAGVLPCFRAR